jgi:hypothetical protein
MTSTSAPKAVEPGDAPPVSADERLAEAHKKITSVDEELARLSSQLEKMEKDTARGPTGAPMKPSAGHYSPSVAVLPSARPDSPSAGTSPQSPQGRPALPIIAGLSLAACVVIAVLALQWTYSGQAKVAVAPSPQLVSTAASPPNDPPLPALSAPSPVPVTSAQAAPVPAVPLAQAVPLDAAPPATSTLPDQTRLQALTRDLANAERTIEQLKADQQQMARENAKTLEELKASQEELKQALAKMSDQKTLPPPAQSPATRSVPTQPATAHPATAFRKPERTYQPPRARARPRYPSGDWYYEEW